MKSCSVRSRWDETDHVGYGGVTGVAKLVGSADNIGFRWSLLALILNYIAGKLIIISLIVFLEFTILIYKKVAASWFLLVTQVTQLHAAILFTKYLSWPSMICLILRRMSTAFTRGARHYPMACKGHGIGGCARSGADCMSNPNCQYQIMY